MIKTREGAIRYRKKYILIIIKDTKNSGREQKLKKVVTNVGRYTLACTCATTSDLSKKEI